ncbi:MAG TPA: hypothetical protein VGN83_09295 [Falsiroseomonas sp.]|jgi:hypothetical protein|nr:hypothetical protein [Falsiroseomonas sp.]
MPRAALLLLPALLAACAGPFGSSPFATGPFATGPFATGPSATTPMGGAPRGERDARYEACRAEATRLVQFRERGQTMRSDETESSRGTVTVAPFARAETDRMLAQLERDRIIEECLRGTPGGGGR